MGLDSLDLKLGYRSKRDDIITDFYLRCLEKATSYDRAVGYFSSNGLAAASEGVAALISRNGKMRLIASPVLSDEDYSEIKKGYEEREREIVEKRILEVLENLPSGEIRRRVGCLAWLVANEMLDIKLAYTIDPAEPGIYHEKIGIFRDDSGNAVAFTGSPNETKGGLVSNFESIDVYCSWTGAIDAARVKGKISDFEQLWNNRTRGLRVMPFPEAAREKIITYSPDRPPTIDTKRTKTLERDQAVELREYQGEAIRSWEENGRRGILSMATGTGKTLTSLKGVEELVNNDWTIIIVVPSKVLMPQWSRAIGEVYADARIITCSSRSEDRSWEKEAFTALNARSLSQKSEGPKKRGLFVIATLGTAHKIRFKRLIYDNWGLKKLCMIVDEVHRSGSETYSHVLDLHAEARLGLSATPKRQWDPIGWKRMLEFFDSIVYEYSIDQAIKDGWLSEYEYEVHFVQLTHNELEGYQQVFGQIKKTLAQLLSRNPQFETIPALLRHVEVHGTEKDQSLCRAVQYQMMKRARILKLAENKIRKSTEVLKDEEFESCIVYCQDTDQLESVARSARRGGLQPAVYHSGLTDEQRATVLKDFEEGPIQTVVAIRCLDEGVDIPKTEGGVLVASDRSRRQFVQRRGRLLRPYKDKIARIHDIFVVPTLDFEYHRALSEEERSILECELSRAYIFSQSARNGKHVERELNRMLVEFGLNIRDLVSMQEE